MDTAAKKRARRLLSWLVGKVDWSLLLFGALLGRWAAQFDEFRHFEADFFLDDFEQGDVRDAQVRAGVNEGTAHGACAGVELADAPGYEVDQNVGVANLLQSFFREFSVQVLLKFKTSGVK
jgi:hypothetical protein